MHVHVHVTTTRTRTRMCTQTTYMYRLALWLHVYSTDPYSAQRMNLKHICKTIKNVPNNFKGGASIYGPFYKNFFFAQESFGWVQLLHNTHNMDSYFYQPWQTLTVHFRILLKCPSRVGDYELKEGEGTPYIDRESQLPRPGWESIPRGENAPHSPPPPK